MRTSWGTSLSADAMGTDSHRRSFDWFVFGDDDTFWLDLRTLRRMLSQYDPTKDWFVGATTEAKNQLESFGRMAFGGAGILVSGPMLGKMAGVWDECHRRFSHVFGGEIGRRGSSTTDPRIRGRDAHAVRGTCDGVDQAGHHDRGKGTASCVSLVCLLRLRWRRI